MQSSNLISMIGYPDSWIVNYDKIMFKKSALLLLRSNKLTLRWKRVSLFLYSIIRLYTTAEDKERPLQIMRAVKLFDDYYWRFRRIKMFYNVKHIIWLCEKISVKSKTVIKTLWWSGLKNQPLCFLQYTTNTAICQGSLDISPGQPHENFIELCWSCTN